MIVDDITESLQDNECLIEAYGRKLGLAADDCILIKERNAAIVRLIQIIQETLTAREFYYFIEWLHEDSYAVIGRLHLPSNLMIFNEKRIKDKERHRKALVKTGKRLISRILKKLEIVGAKNEVICMKDLLMDKNIGAKWGSDHAAFDWPSDMARNHVEKCRFTKNREWSPLKKCMVPEYLRNSFNDNGTVCSYCGIKCTRKTDNKGKLRKSKKGQGMTMGE